jgi:hypothetical protein
LRCGALKPAASLFEVHLEENPTRVDERCACGLESWSTLGGTPLRFDRSGRMNDREQVEQTLRRQLTAFDQFTTRSLGESK